MKSITIPYQRNKRSNIHQPQNPYQYRISTEHRRYRKKYYNIPQGERNISSLHLKDPLLTTNPTVNNPRKSNNGNHSTQNSSHTPTLSNRKKKKTRPIEAFGKYSLNNRKHLIINPIIDYSYHFQKKERNQIITTTIQKSFHSNMTPPRPENVNSSSYPATHLFSNDTNKCH